MTLQSAFEIRLAKTTVQPGMIPLERLVDLLQTVNSGIRSLYAPDEVENTERLSIGLAEVRTSSCVWGFYSPLPAPARRACERFASAVSRRSVRDLPAPALRLARLFETMAKEHNGAIELAEGPGRDPVIVIDASSDLFGPTPVLRGDTVIYGMVMLVGGVKPKVHIRLDAGRSLTCDANAELARQLGDHLYDYVGLEGEAEWDSYDYSVLSFKAYRLTEFRETPLRTAFDALAEASGPAAWADVQDVVEVIARMRQGDEI